MAANGHVLGVVPSWVVFY